ncbi:hypothetical protein YC2023_056140 [Brassica napus]
MWANPNIIYVSRKITQLTAQIHNQISEARKQPLQPKTLNGPEAQKTRPVNRRLDPRVKEADCGTRGCISTISPTRVASASTQPPPSRNTTGITSPQLTFVGAPKP